jgi:hypothetical protein
MCSIKKLQRILLPRYDVAAFALMHFSNEKIINTHLYKLFAWRTFSAASSRCGRFALLAAVRARPENRNTLRVF